MTEAEKPIERERAQERGRERGVEMCRAILEDNYDRQAYLLERKQREFGICLKDFGVETAKAYNKGFTEGLMYTPRLTLKAEEIHPAEEKIDEWVTTLQPKADNAKRAAKETADAVFSAAMDGDALKLKAWLADLTEMRQRHPGIQWREFKAVYEARLRELVDDRAKHRKVEPHTLREILRVRSVPVIL